MRNISLEYTIRNIPFKYTIRKPLFHIVTSRNTTAMTIEEEQAGTCFNTWAILFKTLAVQFLCACIWRENVISKQN